MERENSPRKEILTPKFADEMRLIFGKLKAGIPLPWIHEAYMLYSVNYSYFRFENLHGSFREMFPEIVNLRNNIENKRARTEIGTVLDRISREGYKHAKDPSYDPKFFLVNDIRQASEEDIKHLNGVGKKRAGFIKHIFSKVSE